MIMSFLIILLKDLNKLWGLFKWIFLLRFIVFSYLFLIFEDVKQWYVVSK